MCERDTERTREDKYRDEKIVKIGINLNIPRHRFIPCKDDGYAITCQIFARYKFSLG